MVSHQCVNVFCWYWSEAKTGRRGLKSWKNFLKTNHFKLVGSNPAWFIGIFIFLFFDFWVRDHLLLVSFLVYFFAIFSMIPTPPLFWNFCFFCQFSNLWVRILDLFCLANSIFFAISPCSFAHFRPAGSSPLGVSPFLPLLSTAFWHGLVSTMSRPALQVIPGNNIWHF